MGSTLGEWVSSKTAPHPLTNAAWLLAREEGEREGKAMNRQCTAKGEGGMQRGEEEGR